MSKEQFSRTIRLIGEEAFEKLQNAHVTVIGLGGVGGHAANALCRAGIGSFLLIDGDDINVTNINRQMVARQSTVGKMKVDVMRSDMIDINPRARVVGQKIFLNCENLHEYLDWHTDFVLDCIDALSCKVQIAKMCYNKDIPLISSMGAGNRTQAEFIVTDIYKTENDPVAKIMRQECRKLGIKRLPVVWSKIGPEKPKDGDATPASISFIPPAAGLKMAEYVVNRLIQ